MTRIGTVGVGPRRELELVERFVGDTETGPVALAITGPAASGCLVP